MKLSLLVADCPRCSSKEITFDLKDQIYITTNHGWQTVLEIFCVCRACVRPTVFRVAQKSNSLTSDQAIRNGLKNSKVAVNNIVTVQRYVSVQDNAAEQPPEYLPEKIDAIFREGAACMSIGCHNAAATMFRLCLDLATKSLLPAAAEGLTNQVKRNLGLRLPWLFDNRHLPEALRELSACVKDDGNDGAHDGTLSGEDAADLLDFTFILLERLFTEPKRLELARERRAGRRQ